MNSDAPTTLYDMRVPQPGREAEYGVPQPLIDAAAVLYRHRNTVQDDVVGAIDAAIMRLYQPFIRSGGKP